MRNIPLHIDDAGDANCRAGMGLVEWGWRCGGGPCSGSRRVGCSGTTPGRIARPGVATAAAALAPASCLSRWACSACRRPPISSDPLEAPSAEQVRGRHRCRRPPATARGQGSGMASPARRPRPLVGFVHNERIVVAPEADAASGARARLHRAVPRGAVPVTAPRLNEWLPSGRLVIPRTARPFCS
jgi:hypothetical protein